MKLWQKLALGSGLALTLAVALCSVLLLVQTRDALLSSAQEQAVERQRATANYFQYSADSHALEEDSEAVKRSLYGYLFSAYAGDGSVLVINGETLYSRSDIEPELYLSPVEGGRAEVCSVNVQGRRYFIVGSTPRLLSLPEGQCEIYEIQDMSPIYDRIERMGLSFAAIGLCSALAGLGLTTWLTRRAMRPLAELQSAAAHIAAGAYGERTGIKSRDELGELAQSFDNMAQAVQQHIDELTERAERQELFIGAVGHEFRTPLTGILLHADSLQNISMSGEEQRRALGYIERESRRLERMTEKMLRLLTISRDIEQTAIDPAVLIDTVRESTAVFLDGRGVSLHCECEAKELSGDPELLCTAIINLVDNAAKASAPGQRVYLSIREGLIEVRDQGRGIPADAIGRITEPFYRPDKARSRKEGGAGLGLALVREIARAHRAELEFESREGEGTIVRLRFAR